MWSLTKRCMPQLPQRGGLCFNLPARRRAQEQVPQATTGVAQRMAMMGRPRALGDLAMRRTPGDNQGTEPAMREVLANGAKEPSVSGPTARLRDSGNSSHEINKAK